MIFQTISGCRWQNQSLLPGFCHFSKKKHTIFIENYYFCSKRK